jgi:glycosyltransferase involved in cell wall biosynthesis
MNIGVVHGSNDLYGASRVLLTDVSIFAELGHNVVVRLPGAGPLTQELRAVGCEVEHAPIPVLRRSAPLDVLRANPTSTVGALADADLVVANTLAVLPAVIPLATRRVRPRIVASLHEILPGRVGALLARSAGTTCDAFLANSNATVRWFRAASRTPKAIEMGYPVAPAYRGSRRPRSSSTSSGPTRLIATGRISTRKGQLELADACDHLRAEGRDVSLTVVGAPYHTQAQQRALDALLSFVANRSWIEYLGEKKLPDLLDLMAEHDLCIMASTEVESFGLVIVEAWSAGLPSLAPAVGGAAEAIMLVRGTPFSPDSDDPVGALTSALRFVLEHPSLLTPPQGDEPVSTTCTRARRAAAWARLLGRTM